MLGCKHTLSLILLATCLSGCSNNKIPFTKSIQEEYNLSDQQLTKLQYYVSEEVVFRKENNTQSPHYIDDGVLVTNKTKQINKVILEKETPGILSDNQNRVFYISFEPGYTIAFKVTGSSGQYRLKRIDGKHHRQRFNFNGNAYLAEPKSNNTFLLIEQDALESLVEESKVLDGMEVD